MPVNVPPFTSTHGLPPKPKGANFNQYIAQTIRTAWLRAGHPHVRVLVTHVTPDDAGVIWSNLINGLPPHVADI